MLASPVLAAGMQVNGIHGFLILIAVLLFLIAAIIAWFVPPRTHWGCFVAAGLCLATLALIVSG